MENKEISEEILKKLETPYHMNRLHFYDESLHRMTLSHKEYKLKPNKRVSFKSAMIAYVQGKTIQCRIVDNDGCVLEVENYHVSEGLEIALEFNEILNGHFFIIE